MYSCVQKMKKFHKDQKFEKVKINKHRDGVDRKLCVTLMPIRVTVSGNSHSADDEPWTAMG